MKQAWLSYHTQFPATPISPWVGAKHGWVNEKSQNGGWKDPALRPTPFYRQRKLWCCLHTEFQGVELRFAWPQELDHFLTVMQRNPLPSGPSLLAGQKRGRPNGHWLSRLPAKAKPFQFRTALCAYLNKSPHTQQFRDFYATTPVQTDFPGFYPSVQAAIKARSET